MGHINRFPISVVLWSVVILWFFALFVGALASEKTQLPNACPARHISDFNNEIEKASLAAESMEGAYLRDFFVIHAATARASIEVLNLRPDYGLIVYPPKAPNLTAALLIYFDNKGCYLLSAKIDLGMLKALKATVQKKHV